MENVKILTYTSISRKILMNDLDDTKYKIDFQFIYNVNERHKIDTNKGVLINLV